MVFQNRTSCKQNFGDCVAGKIVAPFLYQVGALTQPVATAVAVSNQIQIPTVLGNCAKDQTPRHFAHHIARVSADHTSKS